jgi:hypothetical protein
MSQNLINSYFAVNEPPRGSHRNEPPRGSHRNEPPRGSYRNEESRDSDDTELLMRQLSVVWDGTIPIRSFLKDKKQILELLNLSVPETITSIKNCFPNEEPFRTCFSNFETYYVNTNYWSLSKFFKNIALAVEEPSFPNLAEIVNNRLIIESPYAVTEVEVEETITDEVEVEVEEAITDEVEVEVEVEETITDEVEVEVEETTDESEVEAIIVDIVESVVESSI